jgi:hypothetical protein
MRSPGLHNVLAVGCKALAIDPSPYDDGAKPVLDDPRFDDLLAWIVRQAMPKLDEKDRKEAEHVFALRGRGRKLTREEGKYLHTGYEPTTTDSEAVVAGLKIYAVTGAQRSARAAARLLGPSFLEALSNELRRLDVVTLVHRFDLPLQGTIVATAWRARNGSKLSHAIVRLDGDRYGLLAKTKGRWTWVQGTRDDVLASVPDALMESAVASVVGGKRGAAQEDGRPKRKRTRRFHVTTTPKPVKRRPAKTKR